MASNNARGWVLVTVVWRLSRRISIEMLIQKPNIAESFLPSINPSKGEAASVVNPFQARFGLVDFTFRIPLAADTSFNLLQ